jgi:hypothetical protein
MRVFGRQTRARNESERRWESPPYLRVGKGGTIDRSRRLRTGWI